MGDHVTAALWRHMETWYTDAMMFRAYIQMCRRINIGQA